MSIFIETSRLFLRQFSETDAKQASCNSKQPIVAHFMSDMVLENEDAALGWIHWINSEKFDAAVPCVILAVELKSTHKCIGLIGAAPKRELNDEVEILFEIADGYQNNGYATEAGKAIIWWAFEQARQDVLSAIVKQENKASRRVVEKLGFVYCDTRILPYDGADCTFDYFRLYHTDTIPGPEWDARTLYMPERMGDFFKARADGYNEHMLSDGKETHYRQLGESVPKTDQAVNILDIGCGTGIELDYIWAQAPNAHITCLDISRDMLALLIKDHRKRLNQITVAEASYFDWNYPTEAFEIAVSSQTMHHFWPEQKTAVYKNLLKALKPGGCYIESDFYVEAACAEQYRRRYTTIIPHVSEQKKAGKYHIDIPCTIEVQRQLFLDAGFAATNVLQSNIRPRGSGGILRAVKSTGFPQIISVREHPEYFERAVDYFSSKWGIDRKIYEDSISDSIKTSNPLPRWYLMLKNNEIIGSYGLIDNDFMVRKDLMPWLCALYIEESERGNALGSKLLVHGRQEAKRLGFDKVYLCTDHVAFYEKYGWCFFGLEESEFGGKTRVYEIESGV